MKINYLILENFAAIKSAMNTHKVEINFTEAKNRVCLFIGPNGSGKTTIMSMLHPFATIGNLDVRDKTNIILKGKSGYKEIEIQSGNDIYTIKHYYTPREGASHSIKSYIIKNGIELNVNGNVTSFKEWVKLELGIEQDYMKLVRLGTNVQSMLDLSETERKNFMSKLLDEVGVFLSYYKKVNNDMKQIKEFISHTTNKINSLNVESKRKIMKDIEELELIIEQQQDEYTRVSNEIAIQYQIINDIEDNDTLAVRVKESRRVREKMERIIERSHDYESTDPEFYRCHLERLSLDNSSYQTEYKASDMVLNSMVDSLNQLVEQKRFINVQLMKEMESDKELSRMKDERNELLEKAKVSKKLLDGFKPYTTKDELEKFVVYLKNTQQLLNKTYEFGQGPVKKVVSMLKKNGNVTSFIDNKLLSNKPDNYENSVFLDNLERSYNFKQDPCPDCSNKKSCEAMKLWNQIANIFNTKELDCTEEIDVDYVKQIGLVYTNIMNILESMKEYKDTILRLPEEYQDDFKFHTVMKRIENLEPLVKEEKYQELLSMTTEYECYIDYKEKAMLMMNDIERFSKLSSYGILEEQLEKISSDIENKERNISDTKSRMRDLLSMIQDNNRTIESYTDLYETFSKYDEVKTHNIELEEVYAKYNNAVESIKTLTSDSIKIKSTLDSLVSELQTSRNVLNMYIRYKKDLKVYNTTYEEMTLIKDALSSKKGMALFYIKDYLDNIEDVTNELLNIAYDGKIYIDKFHITPTEFSIPWYNKGLRMDDVKYASQGELSFLNIAIAFAIAAQEMKKYNIMLLDETDGPLDIKLSAKYVEIIDNHADRVGAEQIFSISHKDMYASYPVDIVDFTFSNNLTDSSGVQRYKYANYIKIKRY